MIGHRFQRLDFIFFLYAPALDSFLAAVLAPFGVMLVDALFGAPPLLAFLALLLREAISDLGALPPLAWLVLLRSDLGAP